MLGTNKKAWASKADEKLDVWKQYPANTFTAYCRRNGLWKVPKQFEFTREGRKREPNWNVDIQSIYAGKLQRAFNVLDEAIDRVATDTASGLETLYGALEEELKGEIFPAPLRFHH